MVGNIHVFKVFEVLDDRLSDEVGFGVPRTLGKTLQTLFDFFGQTNSKHVRNRYTEV